MRTLRLSLVGAVLLGLAGGASSIVLAQETEAPEVTSELIFELSLPSWALPDDLTALEAGNWTLEAGIDVTGEHHTSQANESMRNRAIVVTSGTFLIEPTTEALLWRASGAPPQLTPAGEAVTLRPGEAIYLPAVPADEIDPERYLRVANPGVEDATGMTFHAHEGPTSGGFGGFPPGLRWRTWRGEPVDLRNATDWMAANEVLFRFRTNSGDPGATITSFAAGATSVYRIESGRLEWIVRGPGGEFSRVWRAGAMGSVPAADGVEQTLTVVGDETASFLELTAIPEPSVE